MHSYIGLASLALLSSAYGAPVTDTLVSRQDTEWDEAKGINPQMPYCQGSHTTHSGFIPKDSGFGWTVYIPQPIGLQEGKECGDKFLDYIKAQSAGCASVSSWTCTPVNYGDGTPQGIQAGFDTNIFCGAGQIEKAIWDATDPQIPAGGCSNSPDPPPSASQIITTILSAIGGGAFAGTPIAGNKIPPS